jgi:hypothetical protein
MDMGKLEVMVNNRSEKQNGHKVTEKEKENNRRPDGVATKRTVVVS